MLLGGEIRRIHTRSDDVLKSLNRQQFFHDNNLANRSTLSSRLEDERKSNSSRHKNV